MQLDHLAVEILKKVATEPGMSLNVLCERIGLPQRNFYYRRTRINDWLSAHGFAPLICDARRGVRVADDEAAGIMQQLGVINARSYRLSADERRVNLLLHLACRIQPAFTRHLSERNRVSRNTTLDDIAQLRQQLQHQQLMLSVDKKQGYRLEGSALALRLAVQQMLQHALKYSDHQAEARIAQILLGQLAAVGLDEQRVRQVVDAQLKRAEQLLLRTFTDKDRRVLHYMLLFTLLDTLNGHYPGFSVAQTRFLREQGECEVAAGLNAGLARELNLPDISGNTLFISLLISASKKVTPLEGRKIENNRLMTTVRQLIVQFQALSGVYLQDVGQLESRLYSHLGPAIYRCLFGMQSENVLREETLQRYPLIFRLCRQSIVALEYEYQVVFCDDELSYIVISFAAWLDRRPETGEKHLLLVTEGGSSSTAILENQLRNLTVLPLHIERVSASQIQQQGISGHIRLVVSTVALSCRIPAHVSFIQTQHMLSDSEKQQLRLMLEHNIDAVRISGLVDALVASASRLAPQAKEPLRLEFSSIISQFIQKQRNPVPATSTPALSLFSHVGFASHTTAWRPLIRKAAQPLVDSGVIDSRYARNIIRQIENQGITTYLTPDILLLHDAPPAGITKGALSLLRLRQPLIFDLPGVTLTPRIIVILVPTANLSHIPLLEELNALISNDKKLELLLNANSLYEVQCCLHDGAFFESGHFR
ncbi:PTS sugar transporter subunit IIA [Enterobacter hormaechei]|uniref:PTS sugar transporter subunit IIA n=1 Tax=Enterobacter hormaechei TaxID=158836 RepID=UPI002A751AA0|nr:PTS sugar transporter subunit IIA [Enterobacter hormaechei]MDY3571629.1 PTS sugar transporter subunit IIA [Enterobacter hormaechei]